MMRDNDANVSEGRDHLLRDFSEQMVSHQTKWKKNLPWTLREIHKINLKKQTCLFSFFIKSRTSLFIHVGHGHKNIHENLQFVL